VFIIPMRSSTLSQFCVYLLVSFDYIIFVSFGNSINVGLTSYEILLNVNVSPRTTNVKEKTSNFI